VKEPYFRFTRVHGGVRTSVKFSGDSSVGQVLEAVEDFLRGCGYQIDGVLDVVADDGPPETQE